jgi:hypothetical protein
MVGARSGSHRSTVRSATVSTPKELLTATFQRRPELQNAISADGELWEFCGSLRASSSDAEVRTRQEIERGMATIRHGDFAPFPKSLPSGTTTGPVRITYRNDSPHVLIVLLLARTVEKSLCVPEGSEQLKSAPAPTRSRPAVRAATSCHSTGDMSLSVKHTIRSVFLTPGSPASDLAILGLSASHRRAARGGVHRRRHPDVDAAPQRQRSGRTGHRPNGHASRVGLLSSSPGSDHHDRREGPT